MEIKKVLMTLIMDSLVQGYKNNVISKEDFTKYVMECNDIKNDNEEFLRELVMKLSEERRVAQ